MPKLVKIYKATFNEYTNALRDTVANDYELGSPNKEYLSVPNEFLIREDEIEYYKLFGNGFASLIYIGSMYEKKE